MEVRKGYDITESEVDRKMRLCNRRNFPIGAIPALSTNRRSPLFSGCTQRTNQLNQTFSQPPWTSHASAHTSLIPTIPYARLALLLWLHIPEKSVKNYPIRSTRYDSKIGFWARLEDPGLLSNGSVCLLCFGIGLHLRETALYPFC